MIQTHKQFSSYDQDELRELMMRDASSSASRASRLKAQRSKPIEVAAQRAMTYVEANRSAGVADFADYAGVSMKAARAALNYLADRGWLQMSIDHPAHVYRLTGKKCRAKLPALPWEART